MLLMNAKSLKFILSILLKEYTSSCKISLESKHSFKEVEQVVVVLIMKSALFCLYRTELCHFSSHCIIISASPLELIGLTLSKPYLKIQWRVVKATSFSGAKEHGH